MTGKKGKWRGRVLMLRERERESERQRERVRERERERYVEGWMGRGRGGNRTEMNFSHTPDCRKDFV